MKNIYYNPEAFGLQTVDDVDVAGDWEFDTLLVLQNTTTKELFYLQDSGCSCPTPFEDMTVSDLQPITRGNLKEFEAICFAHKPYNYSRSLEEQILWHDDSLVLFNKVFELL